jgi:hypothetical protein
MISYDLANLTSLDWDFDHLAEAIFTADCPMNNWIFHCHDYWGLSPKAHLGCTQRVNFGNFNEESDDQPSGIP